MSQGNAPIHVLITGASSGIGAALALAYATPGTTLSLHGRDAGRLVAAGAACAARGAGVVTEKGDVTDGPPLARWIAERDAAVPLDVVIANAGISGNVGAKILFATNVGGILNTIEPVMPLMAMRGRGQIALMSSLASFMGMPTAPAYCASKAAVRILGEGLRPRLAASGVTVSVICPGFVDTPLSADNPFPMPMRMTPDDAAIRIVRGLQRGSGRIVFPRRLYWLTRLTEALPRGLVDRYTSRLPRKE